MSGAAARTLPDLYAQALELEPPERERFVAELAASDPTVAAELGRLLAAVDDGPSPLDRSPWRQEAASGAAANCLPDHLGPYRIERELGRGGMGRVFLAQQQGADFTRRVALKVVSPGGAGPEVERRFREERRILAALEHPGIARFYDAGRSEDGTWFLALEYVEGEDILGFLRRRRLALRSRIELFVQVLDAVDFAHRHLVVHRDLKPGNVLVDGEGRAKLLDFGISKMLDTEETEETATRTGFRALTPAYASPEQVLGERITIASDVYSLGVMCYEILAGSRPAPATAAPGTEPLPPSSALRGSRGGQDGGREAWPVRWRELQGDLDAIVLKALRSAPETRYRSAAAFADDLRRWLSGQAVEARRGSRRYRIAKFALRHRVALTAAAAVVLALAGGLSLAMVQRSRALAARARAEATVADLHQLSQAMLFEIYDQVRVLPGSFAVSGTIVRRATEVLDRLAATAGDDPRMLRDLAAGYEQLGAMFATHPAIGRSLDRPRAAVEVLTRAVELRGRVAEREDASFADRLAAAESLGALARAQARAGDRRGGEASARAGVELLQGLEAIAPDRPYLRYRLAVAHTRASGEAGTMASEDPETDPHFVAAARLWQEFAHAPPPAALEEDRFIGEVGPASIVLLRAELAEEALRLSDLGLALFDRRPTPELEPAAQGVRRAQLLVYRSDALDALGRYTEALAVEREIDALHAAAPADPDDLLADSIRRMSNSLKVAKLATRAGDLDYAIRSLDNGERVIDAAEQRYGAASFAAVRVELDRARGDVMVSQAELATTAAERDYLLEGALAHYRSALERVDALGGAAAMHGSPPERIEELRQLARDLESRVR